VTDQTVHWHGRQIVQISRWREYFCLGRWRKYFKGVWNPLTLTRLEICSDTVLTAAGCWPSNYCIPAQKFVSVLAEIKSQLFTFGVGLRQGGVLSSLLFIVYMNWTRKRLFEATDSTVGSLRTICHCFHSLNFDMRLNGFRLRPAYPEW